MTWIRPDIIEAYEALHDAGYAHSVEWDHAGNLVGGLHGVAVGKAFATESMFARQADASKIGLITLSAHLQKWGFVMNDAKRDSGHLRSLSFALMPRAEFNALMAKASSEPRRPGNWVFRWNPQPATSNLGEDRLL